MNKRIAKKIIRRLPVWIRSGDPPYGPYTREQVRRAHCLTFPPGICRLWRWTPMVSVIEDQSLANIKEIPCLDIKPTP